MQNILIESLTTTPIFKGKNVWTRKNSFAKNVSLPSHHAQQFLCDCNMIVTEVATKEERMGNILAIYNFNLETQFFECRASRLCKQSCIAVAFVCIIVFF